ncbi:hypothetical protein [Azospirillum argentinense]
MPALRRRGHSRTAHRDDAGRSRKKLRRVLSEHSMVIDHTGVVKGPAPHE